MTTPDATRNDPNWTPRTRELLDRHAEQLDPVQLRRLLQARQRALTSVRRPRLRLWAFGLGAATAASLLLFVSINPKPDSLNATPSGITAPTPMTIAPIEKALTLPDADLALIASADEYALLQDLEFYAWLEDADHEG